MNSNKIIREFSEILDDKEANSHTDQQQPARGGRKDRAVHGSRGTSREPRSQPEEGLTRLPGHAGLHGEGGGGGKSRHWRDNSAAGTQLRGPAHTRCHSAGKMGSSVDVRGKLTLEVGKEISSAHRCAWGGENPRSERGKYNFSCEKKDEE